MNANPSIRKPANPISPTYLQLPNQTAVAAFPSDCTRNYTVVSGDICDSISKAHNSSTYQLAVVNRDEVDSTCSNLMPGQVICEYLFSPTFCLLRYRNRRSSSRFFELLGCYFSLDRPLVAAYWNFRRILADFSSSAKDFN